jgi:hypothetical protein
MIVVYKIDTGRFDPISYGSNYLYNQYDRIQSFITKLNIDQSQNILSKPVLSNDQVLWYANFTNPFSRLSDLSSQTQIDIKSKYWIVRQHIDKELQQLSLSRDNEKQNWANLLREVFNEDDNIILSDGKDWCLLWGWKFRNTKENYLAPEFMPKMKLGNDDAFSTSNDNSLVDVKAQHVSIDTPIIEQEKIPVIEHNTTTIFPIKPTVWDRIKRFLRTTVYRLWGLILLIMLILFLACLFKKCHNDKVRESCNDMDKINQDLKVIEKKVDDRCIQNK